MQKIIAAMLLAFTMALVLTPWVKSRALAWGAVDKPDQRKVHSKTMPRMGGVAVYLAFVAGSLLALPLGLPLMGLLLGATMITLLGIVDDIRGMSPWIKLLGQMASAAMVIPFGIRVEFITNPLNGDLIYLGAAAIPLTVFWLVAVINAINLIDGLDGLAGGVACIASLTMAAVAWTQLAVLGLPGQGDVIVLSLILAASLLGFLKHNFHPATIFLGDSGSMLLGYSLGIISVLGLTKSATAISVLVPIVILGLPLLDTTFAVLRRFVGHKPIFYPDREHLHHQLMARGFSHRKAVVTMYALSILMGISAVALNLVSTNQAAVLLLMMATLVIYLANKTGVLGARSPKPRYNLLDTKVKERS